MAIVFARCIWAVCWDIIDSKPLILFWYGSTSSCIILLGPEMSLIFCI